MFRSIQLYEAFALVAVHDEWTTFSVMETPYNSDLPQCDEAGWPTISVEEDQCYRALWARFACRVERRLWAGDWTAEGMNTTLGPRYVEIDTRLWEFLRLEPMTDVASGEGVRFTHLRLSATAPVLVPKSVVPQSQTASLRAQLTAWIRNDARAASGPVRRDDQKAAARAAFVGCVITDNMFRDCRRDANLGEVSVQRGRPKVKGLGK
ncbi:hypothetical protein ACFOKI_16490 [Sphingomonas qilianensis]